MKHNWEYKRLGEVCNVIGGSTPKTEISEFWNGSLNWFTPAEISDKKYYASSDRKITEEAVSATGLTLMPPGTVLLTSRAPIGKVGIATEYCYCNQGFKNLVCKDMLFNEYLYYTLIYFSDEIKDKGRGATFKEISKKVTESISIPLPPMEVQQQIVAELDKINEVIEDCRELLRNLDALAQSLFYDYFGDPVTNPKGWQVIKLDSLIQPKKNILRASKNFTQNDFITYIDISSINRNSNSISDPSVLVFGDAPSRAQQCVKHGDLLVSLVRPNLKNIALCRLTSNSLVASSGFCVLRSNNISNPNFLLHLLLSASTTEYLCSKISGAAYPAITENDIRDMLVPVPPLELQEKFAERIEQIDAQKKAVEETIANMQTLLDSRMDYWFNDI